MAIYPSGSYGGPKQRNLIWLYLVFSLLIIGGVIAFLYRNPFKTGKGEIAQPPPSVKAVGVENKISSPKAEPKPAPAQPSTVEAAEPNSGPVSEADKLIAEAMACLNTDPPKIIEARDRLKDVLPMITDSRQRAVVKKQLSELADKWLFSRTIYPQDKLCGSYQVQPGDLLTTIGAKFKVPYEFLMQINNIQKPQLLRAGEAIKVANGPFHIKVYRSNFTMDLYLQNTFVRSFTVGLGKPGMETPTGLWLVKADGKLIKPVWTDPVTGKTYQPDSPDYPLGSRWIGLEGLEGNAKGRTGFAIHGTNDPNQIGAAGSQGCIRLHNGDAVLMYNLLTPGASQVEVVE